MYWNKQSKAGNLDCLTLSRRSVFYWHSNSINGSCEVALATKISQVIEQFSKLQEAGDMVNLNCSNTANTESMSAVHVKVKLTNAVDEEMIQRGLLNPKLLRVYETEALIDTGAVRTVLPESVAQALGLRIRGQQMAKYANGAEEMVGVTSPVIIEIEGRETIESTLVTGDIVLIGQTVLETLDFWVDCKNQQLIPNPEHPNYPVLRI